MHKETEKRVRATLMIAIQTVLKMADVLEATLALMGDEEALCEKDGLPLARGEYRA